MYVDSPSTSTINCRLLKPIDAIHPPTKVGAFWRHFCKARKGLQIQKASYVASTENIDLDVKWEAFTKGLFGQGLYDKGEGRGKTFINKFGTVDKHVLDAGESLIVGNFHLVAFSGTYDYKVTKFGGLKETLLGGEGLVTKINGPEEVYIQTKNLREFVEWLWTLLEPRVRSRAR